MGISSFTLVVNNLDSTMKYYSELLGFEIQEVDKFIKSPYGGTVSTRVRFPGLSALDLVALDDSVDITAHPPFITEFLEQGEGVRLYAVSSSSVADTYAWLTGQGFAMDSVRSFRAAEEAPAGWKGNRDFLSERRSLDFDYVNPPAHLPQFWEYLNFDYERMQTDWKKTFFSYSRMFNNHPNGVVGVLALQIAVEDVDAAREEFLKMGFAAREEHRADNPAHFQLNGNRELHLLTPESPDDEVASFLEVHGAGVFGVVFEVTDLETTHDYLREKLPAGALRMDSATNRLVLLPAYAQGVQMAFQEEPRAQTLLAQQLKMGPPLDSTARSYAEGMYLKYCALCHGENREGYAADFAPSLRSQSLLSTTRTNNFLRYTIQYGRAETAMGGYLNTLGGPLEPIEVELLLQWLYEESGVEEPVELSREPVAGDVALGSQIYLTHCAACHGAEGEGISAPALGNPMLLATATDDFLRYAITEGRDSTLMPAFKDSLSSTEIDAVTAFLRSRASGWDVPQADSITVPEPADYVLNPDGAAPRFDLRKDRFVSAKQLYQALQDSVRIVLLDARSTVAWRQTHIPGAVPVPYYEEPEAFVQHIPKDDNTWIVAYCACPHAASGQVINTLNRHGYKNTAILDEGILVWAQMGYPVEHGH